MRLALELGFFALACGEPDGNVNDASLDAKTSDATIVDVSIDQFGSHCSRIDAQPARRVLRLEAVISLRRRRHAPRNGPRA